jgi:hypothetical protein
VITKTTRKDLAAIHRESEAIRRELVMDEALPCPSFETV